MFQNWKMINPSCAGVAVKYASSDVKKSTKMPPVPIEIHFIYWTAGFSRPETFQTFAFDMNVYEISAVRFAEKRQDKNFNMGMKLTHPLVFGTSLATKSVFGKAVLDKNYCFFFLFFLSGPSGIRFDSHLPKFAVHRLQNLVFMGVGWCPLIYSFNPEIHSDCENENPGTFQTFSFGTIVVSQMSAVPFAEKMIGENSSMQGRNDLSPVFRNSFDP